jgi:hypothetical protein
VIEHYGDSYADDEFPLALKFNVYACRFAGVVLERLRHAGICADLN